MSPKVIRVSEWLTVALAATLIGAVAVAYYAAPVRTTSALEARDLQSRRPLPTWDALLSGKYFEVWEKYLADQVVFRDQLVKAQSYLAVRLFGKRQVRGIVVGEDGWLIESPPRRPAPAMDGRIAAAADKLAALDALVDSYGGRLLYVHVPLKSSFMRDKYPRWVVWPAAYDSFDPKLVKALEERGVEVLDVNVLFQRHRDMQLYYRTDHHWNFEGAFLTYVETMKRLGIRPLPRADWTITVRPNPFVGSENRRLGMAFETADRFVEAVPEHPVRFSLTTEGRKRSSMYTERADPDDPTSYADYMGGNVGEAVIDTKRPEMPDLLFFGDSFTNAMEPLVYVHFNRTRILDLRNYKKMSVFEYVQKHKPDYVIYLLSGHKIEGDKDNADLGELPKS